MSEIKAVKMRHFSIFFRGTYYKIIISFSLFFTLNYWRYYCFFFKQVCALMGNRLDGIFRILYEYESTHSNSETEWAEK